MAQKISAFTNPIKGKYMKFYFGLLDLIGPIFRKKLLLLQLVFFFTAVLQVAGIASIAPFIAIISAPETIQENSILSYLYSAYNFDSTSSFLICYALMVISLLLVGNSISALSLWKLFDFSIRLGADIQRKIYNNYLGNNFEFFASNNSNRLISQFTQEIPRFVYTVVQPMLELISQSIVGIIIVSGLFYLDYKLALIATCLIGFTYLGIFATVRRKVVKYGYKLTELNQRKLLILDESIAGIKEVKLLGNEEYYKKELNAVTEEGLSSASYISLAGDIPKFVVETLIFSAILALAIYILLTKGSNGSALSVLSLYAMAGYKLLPAAQSIYKAVSLIKANGMVIFEIADEMKKSNLRAQVAPIAESPIEMGEITFDDVSYTYPNASSAALSHCQFTIKENRITAFVGASGAGKSTAVDILLGLLSPENGVVNVGLDQLSDETLRAWRSKVGYVPQSIFLLDSSIEKNIAFGVPDHEIDREKIIEAAKLANMHDFICQLPENYEFQVGERGAKLSGGQKQRIGIARALYKNPSVIVFDEATSALDNATEQQILNEIHKISLNKTVIMIAHRLSSIESSDDIIFFCNGSVKSTGTFSELLVSSPDFESLILSGKKNDSEEVQDVL